ncbi:DUF2913 family protein [Escherichia coli O13,129, 135:H26]
MCPYRATDCAAGWSGTGAADHSYVFAGAQKQRRFPRSVAAELDRLLSLGRQKGPAAGLEQRLEYLTGQAGFRSKQYQPLAPQKTSQRGHAHQEMKVIF